MAVLFKIRRKGKDIACFDTLKDAKRYPWPKRGDAIVREYGTYGGRGDMELTWTGSRWRQYRDSDWHNPAVERAGLSQDDREDRLERKVVKAVDRYLREGNGSRRDRVSWLNRTVKELAGKPK